MPETPRRDGPGWGRPRRHPGMDAYPSGPVRRGSAPPTPRATAPRTTEFGAPDTGEEDVLRTNRFSARRADRYPEPPTDHLDATRPPRTGTREHVRITDRPDAPGRPTAGAYRIVTALGRGSRTVAQHGVRTFNKVTRADGADESGMAALTYTTIVNFATDAVLAVALANTLFFAGATAESKSKVALYLLVTIAPFAVIAPVIGPALDRIQRGRRLLMSLTFAVRAMLAVVLATNFDQSWVLYPAALGMMIMSKTYGVLRGSMAPRVVPPQLDLVRVNSRLTIIGHVLGTAIAGPIAAAIVFLGGSDSGALWFLMVVAVAGAYLCMQIPKWAERTEGEVPATFGNRHDPDNPPPDENPTLVIRRGSARQPLTRDILTALWSNGSIRLVTGFLTLFVAFVAKDTAANTTDQLMILGLVGAAASVGTFGGNAVAARLPLGRPVVIVLGATVPVGVVSLLSALTGEVWMVTITALVASLCSAVAKSALDAAIQDGLPEESQASAFGRSETVLQLSWVFGGALGVLLPTNFSIGFAVVTALLLLSLTQTFLASRGISLIPALARRGPQPGPTFPHLREDRTRR